MHCNLKLDNANRHAGSTTVNPVLQENLQYSQLKLVTLSFTALQTTEKA